MRGAADQLDLLDKIIVVLRQQGSGLIGIETRNQILFCQRTAVTGLVSMNRIGVEVVNAAEIAAHADGPVDGCAGNAQHFFNLVHQFDGVTDVTVEFVDEGDDGRVPEATDIHQLDGAVLNTLGAVDHHERGVDRRQGPIGVLRKVLVARCIQ